MAQAAHFFIGRIGRAVGLRGEVEVAVESDSPDRFAPGSVVLLRDDLRALTVRTHRAHGDRTIVSFEEVVDRSAAEKLAGAELVIEATHARALDPDEYWDHDLIGCEVVTTSGERVGDVTDVLHQPSGELLVVRDGTREHLVPLVGDIVKSVRTGARITIDPLPGLLD